MPDRTCLDKEEFVFFRLDCMCCDLMTKLWLPFTRLSVLPQTDCTSANWHCLSILSLLFYLSSLRPSQPTAVFVEEVGFVLLWLHFCVLMHLGPWGQKMEVSFSKLLFPLIKNDLSRCSLSPTCSQTGQLGDTSDTNVLSGSFLLGWSDRECESTLKGERVYI